MTFEEKYQALVDKDHSFEGMFITAVKTTGIFCRPGCSARKPKKSNVEFFDTTQEALQSGYRPCKVCKPMVMAGELPDHIADLLRSMEIFPGNKIKDKDLVINGLKPNTIRRWFRKNYGMTFHAYQRMLRLKNAYQNITSGKPVTRSAFESGYESLSGFNNGFQKVFGSPPTKSDQKRIINMLRLATPLGPMFACAVNEGICLLEFYNPSTIKSKFENLCRKLGGVILPGSNRHLVLLQEELRDYFLGKEKRFKVPLHFPGTPFQMKVWRLLQTIPFGESHSYAAIAKRLGKPSAVRAVGNANGQNRIAIIIPCHRVIGSNGNLRGYEGGLTRKQWLLNHELKHK